MNAFRLFVCAVIYMITVIMGGQAKAQLYQGKSFLYPVTQGGNVPNCRFNSTNCAKVGWYHAGIDIGGYGTTNPAVIASNDGYIYSITINGRNDHGMGNCIIIKHYVVTSADGTKVMPYYTMYAHMDTMKAFKIDQQVWRGQSIGTVGGTGYGKPNYWGKHLHFEVKSAGVLNNPYGGGPYWGYTPKPAQNYGYTDPSNVIGSQFWQTRK